MPNDLIYKIAVDHKPRKIITLMSMEDEYEAYHFLKKSLLYKYIKNINELEIHHAYEVILYLIKNNKRDLLLQVSMNLDEFIRKQLFLFDNYAYPYRTLAYEIFY